MCCERRTVHGRKEMITARTINVNVGEFRKTGPIHFVGSQTDE